MLTRLLIGIALLGIAVLGLSVRILWGSDHRFGAHDVGESKAMRERGIHCAKSQDREQRRSNPHRINPSKL